MRLEQNSMSLQHCVYEFKGSTLCPLDADPLADLSDDPEAAGYYGHSDETRIVAVYEAVKATPVTERWQFLVEFSPALYGVYSIFVADLPALVQLLGLLGPYALLAQAEAVQGRCGRRGKWGAA